jgi:hypothetical protein
MHRTSPPRTIRTQCGVERLQEGSTDLTQHVPEPNEPPRVCVSDA